MKPIVIVGAGITGCVIALELAQKGRKVILVEKGAKVGGLAKTFHYDKFSFDIGPHRFYSQKQEISGFISRVLGGDYAVLSRHSEVYFFGKYYCWPLRPEVLFRLPLRIMLKSARDLLFLCFKNKKKIADSFEEYILANYGPSLYNVFFKDFTQKFLGEDPANIHSEWAKEGMKRTIIDERIASRNLLDIFKLFFCFKPPKTEFIYPKEGTGVFCNRLAEQVKACGGQIRTSTVITSVQSVGDRIDNISLGQAIIEPQLVVWTGPLGDICDLLGFACDGVAYLSLILFNIEIKKVIKKDFQWCYYGSKEIIFSRITMPSSFSDIMAPVKKDSLCVEISCRQGDESWNNPDRLIGHISRDLIKVGLIERLNDIEAVHIEKISDAYPIYTKDYVKDLKKVKDNLGKFKGLVLAGRAGLFWYNNMDDCIENGLKIARSILGDG